MNDLEALRATLKFLGPEIVVERKSGEPCSGSDKQVVTVCETKRQDYICETTMRSDLSGNQALRLPS